MNNCLFSLKTELPVYCSIAVGRTVNILETCQCFTNHLQTHTEKRDDTQRLNASQPEAVVMLFYQRLMAMNQLYAM